MAPCGLPKALWPLRFLLFTTQAVGGHGGEVWLSRVTQPQAGSFEVWVGVCSLGSGLFFPILVKQQDSFLRFQSQPHWFLAVTASP